MSAEHFREHGYLLCERVFAAEVEEMRNALERILETVAGTKHDENHAWSGVSQDAVLKGSTTFSTTTRHSPGRRTTRRCSSSRPSKGRHFPMHQDYPYFPHTRHSVLAASVHLDDTNERNGCLRVIAGSHKRGPLESRGASNTLEVPHVDWGQGMMVAGRNPFYWERHPRFEVKPA